MKIQKIFIALITLTASFGAFAHCPSSYKEENVCFMLDDNTVYIYDHKVEHNGPYKDFEKSEVLGFKNLKGTKLEYKKLARGIYKIESKEKEKSLILEVSLDKKKKDIKISHE